MPSQRLDLIIPDCLTLDMRRITSMGVVSGHGFASQPIAQLSHRFGAAPAGDSGADAQAEALEALAAALTTCEAAADRHTAAGAVRRSTRRVSQPRRLNHTAGHASPPGLPLCAGGLALETSDARPLRLPPVPGLCERTCGVAVGARHERGPGQ